MGGKISMILSGTGLLIGIYLIISHAKATTQIINQLGSTYSGAVKTLQGR